MSKKVLLINSTVFFDSGWGKPFKPFNPQLLMLDSFLKRNSVNANVLDLEIELGRPCSESEINIFKRNAEKLISRYDFEIVGISCFASTYYLSSLAIARICKKINPSCIIAVGGYHPTVLPQDFISEEKLFDFVVRGEGEFALLKICKSTRYEKSPQIIDGMSLALDKDFYLDWQGYRYFNKHCSSVGIYLSRGCPFRCAFCAEPLKNVQYQKKYRSFPVASAIKQIKEVCNILNPREIRILDACFGFDKAWCRSFLQALIKEKIEKLFWVQSRIDLFEKKDVDLFSQLNFCIDFGVESFSKRMLLIMQKTDKPGRYLEHFQSISNYANQKKLLHSIYLIFNHPGETQSTMDETFAYLEDKFSGDSRNKISLQIGAQDYFFSPGSHIFCNLDYYKNKFGTVIKNKEWWKEFCPQQKLAVDIIPSFNLNGRLKWLRRFNLLRNKINNQLTNAAALLSFSFNTAGKNN